MTGTDNGSGLPGFLAGLQRCGVAAAVTGTVVTYDVLACTGPLTGTAVPTGVTVGELDGWPVLPPHWVHLPAHVHLARTNADPNDTLPGWVRHSRQIEGWGNAAEPGQAWLAHVRGVLGEAAQ